MLLNESPDHKKRIGQVNVANLQQIITIGKIGFNWEKEHKFVAERYEAAKTDLILLITEQIKNPD
ncbi:hypothetical protein [Mucilaginibacter endophyticus]|uniref:hypothetical protein n=1 Tax=Mucilaginibacter endophyticus TaxID=2675003 RepID=UPI000E0DE6EA|nr:hypothetical protein [Mucilaginibacter endophyticus]